MAELSDNNLLNTNGMWNSGSGADAGTTQSKRDANFAFQRGKSSLEEKGAFKDQEHVIHVDLP